MVDEERKDRVSVKMDALLAASIMIALKVCGANGAGHLLSLWFLLDAHSLVVNIVKKKKKRNIPMPFTPSLHHGLLRHQCDGRWTVLVVVAAWCWCAELAVGVVCCSVHVASNITFSKVK